MKPRNFTIVVASSLLLPVAALAQSSSLRPHERDPALSPTTNNPPFQTAAVPGDSIGGTNASGASSIQKVEQDALEQTFTARDLIGKQVANHDGQRLGTINDVALGDAWAQRFGLPQSNPVGSPTEPFSQTGRSDLRVFISTGGPLGLGGRLGMGADWVSVPADNLLYDRQNERFILNMALDQFTDIAKGRTGSDVATTTGSEFPTATVPGSTTSRRGTIGSPSPVSTTPSGQIGANPINTVDLNRIENALQNHAELRNRSNIRVSRAGNALQLSGTVDQPHLIRRAGDLARQHTSLEVRNLLEVSGFAAE